MRATKGVANRTVARLFAELPEIGIYSNKAVGRARRPGAARPRSGAKAGKRHIRGGRAGIRSILFLVAGIVSRFDDSLAAFHRKLTAAGKPKKVVRIALARKLLVCLNAKAREARQHNMHLQLDSSDSRSPRKERGEGWGEGVTIERVVPPHPHPLPDGERESRRATGPVRALQQGLAKNGTTSPS